MASLLSTWCFLFMFIFSALLFSAENSFSVEIPALETKSNGAPVKNANGKEMPTILITLLVRNKAHTLAWFLGSLERLDYPKDRIGIWIRSDHNTDNTSSILKEWVDGIKDEYHFIDMEIDEETTKYSDQTGHCHWSDERFSNVMRIRENALEAGRYYWSDYVFMIDVDVILYNNQTLKMLVDQKKTLVAPMLETSSESLYSNFWAGMNEKGYYQRTKMYVPIQERETVGCIPVAMIHSVILIDMRDTVTKQLSYIPPDGYKGPYDDIIVFAYSAKRAGIEMNILNAEKFGIIVVPMDAHNTLAEEAEQFTFVKLDYMIDHPPLPVSPHIYIPDKPTDKLGFDQVYLINLERRPERKVRMLASLKEMGVEAYLIDAIDGLKLNDSYIDKLGIQMLPGYSDPYSKRVLTLGEIGCFLSHYRIWNDMIENNYDRVIVFEDDVRFEAYFRTRLANLMREADAWVNDWDLIYIGRKILNIDNEIEVHGTTTLVWPQYSYWTLSYTLSKSGASKLLAQDPLKKLVPVDEYFPIMFDKHPETEWRSQFWPRNLVTMSANPLLAYPEKYVGEEQYISDTEYSEVVDEFETYSSNKEEGKDEL